jgi:outer membrane protein assembly factor BamB
MYLTSIESDMGAVIFASPYIASLNSIINNNNNNNNNISNEHIIIVATTSGNILLVNSNNGEIITSYRLRGEIYSSPVVVGHTIYVGCRDDRLYSLKINF